MCFVPICGYVRLLRQAQACTGGGRHSLGLYVYHGDSGGPATSSRPPITTKLEFFSLFFFKNTRLGTNKMHPSPCVLTTAGLRTREKNTVAPPVLRTEPTSGACAKRTF